MSKSLERADLFLWRVEPPALPGGFYRLLRQAFLRDPSKVALETPDCPPISYAELDSLVERCRAGLEACGIEQGDRVLVYVEKSPANVFLYLACLSLGAIYVPVNPSYTPAELAAFVEDAGPRLVICDSPRRSAIGGLLKDLGSPARVAPLRPDGLVALGTPPTRPSGPAGGRGPAGSDPAVILYTSGTTGAPRGAVLTHQALAANALALCRAWDFRPEDVLVHALPLFHTHGLFVALHCALLSGASILFMTAFDTGTAIRLWRRATVFMGVPTQYTRLLSDPGLCVEAAAGMRLFTCGSAPLLPQTWEDFRLRSGHRIVERYGMTEVGIVTSNPYRGERIPGTVGYPLEGVEIKVVDEAGSEREPGATGELRVRSPGSFSGYLAKPGETARALSPDGWVATGDLAVRAGDGRVTLVGRSKDVIITGALNVHPPEVEAALNSLPGVVESAVFGAPHPDFGEGVVAAVVWDGESNPSSARLRQALFDRLARYKIPKRILITERLPRNAMGKVQKTVLRSRNADVFTSQQHRETRRSGNPT
ncbi:MAG: AMP-binding protein [bacterium]|nr:AMP-binding protein [bacterium]MDE0600734.1 AMP-binding protein [bacterium]